MQTKNIKYWIIGGLLVLNIFMNIEPVSSKADGNIQSKGKIVYDNTSATGEEIVIDTYDHSLLKNNMMANGTEIVSLKEFVSTQNTLNAQLQNKDTQLEDNISTLTSNLGNLEFAIVDGQPQWKVQGTDQYNDLIKEIKPIFINKNYSPSCTLSLTSTIPAGYKHALIVINAVNNYGSLNTVKSSTGETAVELAHSWTGTTNVSNNELVVHLFTFNSTEVEHVIESNISDNATARYGSHIQVFAF